jgi:hypothetical protein
MQSHQSPLSQDQPKRMRRGQSQCDPCDRSCAMTPVVKGFGMAKRAERLTRRPRSVAVCPCRSLQCEARAVGVLDGVCSVCACVARMQHGRARRRGAPPNTSDTRERLHGHGDGTGEEGISQGPMGQAQRPMARRAPAARGHRVRTHQTSTRLCLYANSGATRRRHNEPAAARWRDT